MELTDKELKELKRVQGTAEWGPVVQAILDRRGGQYPPDWYEKVLENPEIELMFKTHEFETTDEFMEYLLGRLD